MDIKLNQTHYTSLMLSIAAVLIGLHVVMLAIYFWINNYQQFDFINLVDMNGEANLPALFSSFNLITAGLLCFLSARVDDERRFYWRLLGMLLIFMAIDESVSLHEEYFGPWTDLLVESYGHQASGYFYYAWIMPYGALTLVCGAVFVKFLLHLPRHTALGMMLSGAIFVVGAIGFEMLAGMEVTVNNDANSLYYRLVSTIEETLEILAIILFNHVLLTFLASHKTKLGLSSKHEPKNTD